MPVSRRVEGDSYLGVAKPGAIRLDDCYAQLCELLSGRPAIDADGILAGQIRVMLSGSPDADEWNHRVLMEEVAEIALRRAILGGQFPVWIVAEGGASLVDRRSLPAISHNSLASGALLSQDNPPKNLEGRPLWVGRDDWETFWRGLLIDRYGDQAAGGVPKMGQKRRGRRPGTGFDVADRPLLQKMRDLITDNPALNAHSAALRVASEAAGDGTFDSKVMRLSKKYRALFREPHTLDVIK